MPPKHHFSNLWLSFDTVTCSNNYKKSTRTTWSWKPNSSPIQKSILCLHQTRRSTAHWATTWTRPQSLSNWSRLWSQLTHWVCLGFTCRCRSSVSFCLNTNFSGARRTLPAQLNSTCVLNVSLSHRKLQVSRSWSTVNCSREIVSAWRMISSFRCTSPESSNLSIRMMSTLLWEWLMAQCKLSLVSKLCPRIAGLLLSHRLLKMTKSLVLISSFLVN